MTDEKNMKKVKSPCGCEGHISIVGIGVIIDKVCGKPQPHFKEWRLIL
jgi:hypothetical protein